jgi:hypothetical protein
VTKRKARGAQRVTVLIAEKEMVPDEGIEPPTFGLQNRCSTAELIRLYRAFWPTNWQFATQLLPFFVARAAIGHVSFCASNAPSAFARRREALRSRFAQRSHARDGTGLF